MNSSSSTVPIAGGTIACTANGSPARGRTINGHTLVDLTPPHDNLHKLAVTKAVLWARLIYNRTAVRAQFPKRKPVFSAPVTLYIFKVVNKSQQQQQTESWASNSVIYPTPFFQRSSEMHQRKTSGRSSSSSSSSSANYQQQNSGAAYNESNRLQFSLLTTHRLTKPSRGWTQIDLTAAVADWYAQASSAPFLAREKLTLLIDCVGCNQLLEIDLATGHRPAAQKKNRNNSNNSNNRPQKGSTAGNSRSGSKQSSFQTTSNNITSITSNQTIKSRNYSVGEKTNSQAVTALEAYHHKTPGARKPRRHFQPFVVITTRTKLKRRSRRHAYNCEDGKIKQCCKQSLYVDFSLLGWDDWIIYPKGYTANYCMGECVQLHRSPDVMAYFHSHVIEEYRMKNPYASITPCCAPTKLSSISLIYFDPEGHIIKSDLPKMVVDECGCT
ncbi:hypothetical protein TYRP_006661 [Tyrophagus putrescentiae]|nr:hypothetical protein TYRP_006661 [Tyrophagus putrescentiae]